MSNGIRDKNHQAHGQPGQARSGVYLVEGGRKGDQDCGKVCEGAVGVRGYGEKTKDSKRDILVGTQRHPQLDKENHHNTLTLTPPLLNDPLPQVLEVEIPLFIVQTHENHILNQEQEFIIDKQLAQEVGSV